MVFSVDEVPLVAPGDEEVDWDPPKVHPDPSVLRWFNLEGNALTRRECCFEFEPSRFTIVPQ